MAIICEEITGDLGLWTDVIKSSFVSVVESLKLTEDLVPSNGAYIKVETLHRMAQQGATFFGLWVDDLPVGFVALVKAGDFSYRLEKLAVLPSYRHRGYGQLLVGRGLDYLRHHGIKQVGIGVIDEQSELIEWYKKLGFQTIKHQTFKHLPFKVCFMKLYIG